MTTPRLITVDGPAGAGKGTLAKRLAAHFGYAHLDTGKLYRAVGLNTLAAGGDPARPGDAIAAARALDSAAIASGGLRKPANWRAIRLPPRPRKWRPSRKCGRCCWRSSATSPQTRQRMPSGAVLDGRDTGTVVCPDAPVKFFITASAEERAKRRHKELLDRGEASIYPRVLADMKERDVRDSTRAIAPLRAADDARTIDTSEMDADAVFAAALEFIAIYRLSS